MGPGYSVRWLDSRDERWQVAKLLYGSAFIRLTTREGYEVHRETIEWGKRYSEDRIPEKAVGVDWLTLRIMKWALKSWSRIQFLNCGKGAPAILADGRKAQLAVSTGDDTVDFCWLLGQGSKVYSG